MTTTRSATSDPTSRQRERIHFDQLAETCGDSWWGHGYPAGMRRLERKAALLCRRLDALANPQVLEIGCGAGIFTKAILDVRPDLALTGVDISPKSVQIAQTRCAGFANLRLRAGDVFGLDEAAESFHAVIGNSILHHIDVDQFLPKAIELLQPGGLLWFSEPNMMNPQVAMERNLRPVGKRLQNSEDETAFFRWGLQRRLQSAGFVRCEVKPFDFLHPLVPRFAMGVVERLGRSLERTPVLREIAGSLCVVAHKPGP